MIRLLNAHIPSRTLLLGISEAVLITTALVASALARPGAGETRFMLTYQYGSLKIVLVSVAFLTCMYYFDLYDSAVVGNLREALVRLIQVLGVAYIALGLLYYLYPQVKLGRGIFHLGFLFVGLLLLLWRRLFSAINSSQGLCERVIILGEGSLAESLAYEIKMRPELGICLAVRPQLPAIENHLGDHETAKMPVILSQASLRESFGVSRPVLGIDRIVVAMEERRGKLPVDLLLSLKNRGVQVQDGNDVYESITGKVPIESIRLSWLLFSPGSHASRYFLLYKRFASVMISIVGLLLSLPMIPFVVLAIKLSSRGRVLYWQNRVGRDDKIFRCCKFRTMRSDAEADSGPIWAKDDDPASRGWGDSFARRASMRFPSC